MPKQKVKIIPFKKYKKQNYIELCYDACNEFQDSIRKQGLKTFSVWKYLEEEYFDNHKGRHRGPPKAATIRQWFDTDPITGAKMGTEDLKFICERIENPVPLIAYYEESMELFDIKKDIVIDHTTTFTRKLHLTSILIGKLYEEYDRALADDGKVDKEEADRILAHVETMFEHLTTVKNTLERAEK